MIDRVCLGASGRTFLVRVGRAAAGWARPLWRITATDCQTGETFDLPIAGDVGSELVAWLDRSSDPAWRRHVQTYLLAQAAEFVGRRW